MFTVNQPRSVMIKDKYLGIISRDVIWATENDTAQHIATLMKNHNISAIVIKRGDEIVGMVSERELATEIVANARNPELTLVSEFMNRKVLKLEFKEGLNKIYQTLCEVDFKHLLIMHESKLVGITSRKDLLDALTGRKNI